MKVSGKILTTVLAACLVLCAKAQTEVRMLEGEKWWGCVTDWGDKMPFDERTQLWADLWHDNFNNQTTPLLVSNRGRYVWCDDVFAIQIAGGVISLQTKGKVEYVETGGGLREAYLSASAAHFPASGKIPEELFFSQPQYNTWIELLRNQNQADVLKYAYGIIDSGLPPGILMVDDNWQQSYGNFDFRADKFPDPKGMTEELHRMGFRIMLWISPFVTADSQEFKLCREKGYLLKRKGSDEPIIVKWWNGYSAVFDMSNPATNDYLYATLQKVQQEYGIDGFKFDGGDPQYYDEQMATAFDGKSYGPRQTELWSKFASRFPFNELRASWKMGAQPVVQRLGDKGYAWKEVKRLVPNMIAAGLMGHLFTCPDMIGGGSDSSFKRTAEEGFDGALVVRSCQIHSLMPMMQFSVAPWRVLGKEHMDICRTSALLHSRLGSYVLEQAKYAAQSGEPIVRAMEYAYPNQGFEECMDQYMLGDKYLMAPATDDGAARVVKLPKGRWRDDEGKFYLGGKSYTIVVPLQRMLYFEKVK